MSYPRTVKDRFLQLRAEGKSYRAIAAELHVGRSTLLDWGRQFQADIDALRAIRIEALKEQYQLLYHHQVQLLAKQIQTVRDMLNRCDLSDMPANKLLDMQLKLLTAIQKLPAAPVESLPIPDDFTDPDDQTLPPDLTIPIPAGADDPKTKTRPESDQSETTAETKTRPIPDHADEPIPPPPQNASTIELQRYSAILEEYKFQRHYQKSLQALSPRKLFEKCEQVVDAAAAGKQDQYLDPRPLIENLSPPPDDPQPLLNEPRP